MGKGVIDVTLVLLKWCAMSCLPTPCLVVSHAAITIVTHLHPDMQKLHMALSRMLQASAANSVRH